MFRPLGKQALVVGAGIGGLATARVLADYFERVIVLERDVLPEDAEARAGVPQGNQVHGLLTGGQLALGALFPDFARDLDQAGAVTLTAGLDTRVERPGYDPFPQRDLGFSIYALSRPQLELCVRRRVDTLDNVELRPRCRVRTLVAGADRASVRGVAYQGADGAMVMLEAELVVDASGQGTLTLDLLTELGQMLPEQTRIGVERSSASAVFAIADTAPRDWKAVLTAPEAPGNGHSALMMPIEARRWILNLGGQPDKGPSGELEGFLAHAQKLRTSTVYDAIKDAVCLSPISRYHFRESVYRHYDRLPFFPRGLLALGDAICRFNPAYGQDMSVAAQQAQALGQLLRDRATAPDPIEGLAQSFFIQASTLIEGPWAMASLADFANPSTRGDRPPDLEQRFKIGRAVRQLAARDPAVHKLTAEVAHLLKPRSVFQEPELRQRIQEVMVAG